MKKMTIQEVAAHAKVTPSTVSRVLNNSPNVKESTRERVQASMQFLSYTPNQVARSLKSGKSKIIGLVVSQMQISEMVFNPGFQATFKSITEKAQKEGYNILLITSAGTDYESYINVIGNHTADGFIIIGAIENDSLSKTMDSEGIPYVFNAIYSTSPTDNYYVAHDDVEGGYIAAKYLLDLNHRDIKMLVGDVKGKVLSFNLGRIRGFQKSLEEYNLPFRDEQIIKIPGNMEASYHHVRQLVKENNSTAFLISNEITAIAALNVFQDVGISVPNDISIIAFGHSDFFRNTRPSLTTVSYDIEWTGHQMVELLIKRINGEVFTPIVIKKPELVIRESTKKMK
jgi:DNA-binding LacI/PurR family transcriptional regulator